MTLLVWLAPIKRGVYHTMDCDNELSTNQEIMQQFGRTVITLSNRYRVVPTSGQVNGSL